MVEGFEEDGVFGFAGEHFYAGGDLAFVCDRSVFGGFEEGFDVGECGLGHTSYQSCFCLFETWTN